jgi:hypothetical protein
MEAPTGEQCNSVKMITPMFNLANVTANIQQGAEQLADDNALRILTYCGEAGVTYARNNGDYINRTGNLRNSIGYIIAKDGVVIADGFNQVTYGTDNSGGVASGRQLALEVLQDQRTGWILILVAGMEYAVKVESYGKDVLSGSSVYLVGFLETMLRM